MALCSLLQYCAFIFLAEIQLGLFSGSGPKYTPPPAPPPMAAPATLASASVASSASQHNQMAAAAAEGYGDSGKQGVNPGSVKTAKTTLGGVT